MSDVFLSYASEDRPRAQQIAEALRTRGWSVWWDRTIPAGKRFEDVIDNALKQARSIVVLWSKVSITKDWVLEEAEEGRERQIFIPVFIADVVPPRGFRRYQAADLTDWNGEPNAAALLKLFSDTAEVIGPPAIMEA